tara:strand:- start:179 stop:829 length:651 start_codon:yes stop_codon:yes gene_type:complete
MSADVDYTWKDIVIGSDFEAVKFAHENHFVLIKNREPHHHSYEGVEELWADKLYELYEQGLVPFTDKILNLRIDLENKILSVKGHNQSWTVKYENIYQYDESNVEGGKLNRNPEYYRVFDWFDCQGLYDLNVETLATEDKFVSKVTFFKSLRIDGNQRYLDLFCESILTQDQLKNFDYGETMARLKTTKLILDRLDKKVQMSLWKRDVYPLYKREI